MSVSKWAYTPDKCDGDICVGDCDYCPKKEEECTTEKDTSSDEDVTNQ